MSIGTKSLTATQRQQFKEEGYVAVPNFFTEKEVAAMCVELERFKQEGLGRNVATDGDGTTHSTTRVNYQIIPLNDKSTLFRAMPFHPKIIDHVGQLIGTPFVRHLDQIFLKPARTGAGTGWHTDNAYFKISDPTKGTGMWIALHEATIDNGTLHVVPGSYKQTFEHERDPHSDHHIHAQVDDSRALAIELPAGGAVFFNYGTRANTTDKERAGLAFHFLRSDYIPTGEGSERWKLVHLTGEKATGGEAEYGQRVEGTWEREVEMLLSSA